MDSDTAVQDNETTISSIHDVQVIELGVNSDNIEDDVLTVIKSIKPTWSNKENVNIKVFTDGITNKLLGISHKENPEEILLVRIYGKNTHLLVDRDAEKSNFKTLYEAQLAPRLYAEFNNGLVYEYVKGVTLDVNSVKKPDIFPLVARNMAQLHKVHSNIKQTKIWNKLKNMFNLIPKEFSCPKKQERFMQYFPGGLDQLKSDIEFIEEKLSKTKSPLVFCHNDLLLGNVIYDKDINKVTFIDYEYAYVNYQAFDIANHFNEFSGVVPIDNSLYPSPEFQLHWLKIYLEEFNGSTPTNQQLSTLQWQVQQFSSLGQLHWAIWGLVQANMSELEFDFLEYAKELYAGYKTKREKYLSAPDNNNVPQ